MGNKIEFYVAGVKFHEANRPINRNDGKGVHRIIEELEEGIPLVIEMEPENKYDPNAVKIIYLNDETEHMLGYVPKKYSATVSGWIEHLPGVKCTLTKLDVNAKPWEQLWVEIEEDVDWEDEEEDNEDA